MKSSPVVVMAVSGIGAIGAIRIIVGPTKGYEADAGSIRGDFSMSTQSNIVLRYLPNNCIFSIHPCSGWSKLSTGYSKYSENISISSIFLYSIISSSLKNRLISVVPFSTESEA